MLGRPTAIDRDLGGKWPNKYTVIAVHNYKLKFAHNDPSIPKSSAIVVLQELRIIKVTLSATCSDCYF